ncbi:MAG: polysaccharide deacetylase family protein [Verrucomicrobiota bacterium]
MILLFLLRFGSLQHEFITSGKLADQLPDAIVLFPPAAPKSFYLTIDDGPSEHTSSLLTLLSIHQATATFFLHTDQILAMGEEGSTLVSRILAEGHGIGHHMPKDRPSLTLTPKEFAAAFTRSHQDLGNLAVKTQWFRPAGGGYDPEYMLSSLQAHGYHPRFVLASYFPWDTHFPFPKVYADQIANHWISGGIVVLHDASPGNENRAKRTLITMDHLLKRASEDGWKAKALPTSSEISWD